MKMNKKGFTLMELLATVVILGIISTIGIVSVNKVLDKSHKEYEVKQAKMVTTAAQSYFTDNKSLLPKEVLTNNFVSLKSLIDNNYIDKVVDYKKREYDYQRSITTVRKMAANRYVYYSKLIRKDGSKAVDENPENIKSDDIYIYLDTYDLSENSRKEDVGRIYYVNNKISMNLSIRSMDNISKISAYKYIIYRVDGSSKKIYKKSENIIIDKPTYNDKIILSKENLADGKYTVEVIAYDYNGNSAETTSADIEIDTIKPKCTIEEEGSKSSTGWYSYSVDLKMNINEKNIYRNNLSTDSYFDVSKLPISYATSVKAIQEDDTSAEGVIWYGYVEDKAGNVGNCDTLIKVDSKQGTCHIVLKDKNGNPLFTTDGYQSNPGYAFKDYNEMIIDSYCDNNVSGCKFLYWSHMYNYPEDKWKTLPINWTNNFHDGYEAKNRYVFYYESNSGVPYHCTYVRVEDNKAPTCTVNELGDKWYSSDVNVIGKCSDEGESYVDDLGIPKTKPASGCVNEVISFNATAEGKYNVSPGTVYDLYGNSFTCPSVEVKIDKTPPICNVKKTETTDGYKISIGCIDNGSGCSSVTNYRNVTESAYVDLGWIYDNAGNASYCGEEYIEIIDSKISVSIDNPYKDKWYSSNDKGSYNLKLKYKGNYKIEKIERYDDGILSATIDKNGDCDAEKECTYTTTHDFSSEDQNTKVCFKVYDSTNHYAKKCTKVKVDKTPPTVDEPKEISYACNSTVSTHYYNITMMDYMSGLNIAEFLWATTNQINAGASTSRSGNVHTGCLAASVAKSNLALKYNVCDVAGNCRKQNCTWCK